MISIGHCIAARCKNLRRYFISCVLIIFTTYSGACAEEFMGIKFSWGMKELKGEFPGAKFVDLKPAWAKKDQRLIEMQGNGFEGSIIILFEHYTFQKCKSLQNKLFGETDGEIIESACAHLKKSTFERDAMIGWVRWIPSRGLPLQSFFEKYGEADTTEFTQDMEKTYIWKHRGVTAFVDGESDAVSRLEYKPSISEKFHCDDDEIIPGEHRNCIVFKQIDDALTKKERQNLLMSLQNNREGE